MEILKFLYTYTNKSENVQVNKIVKFFSFCLLIQILKSQVPDGQDLKSGSPLQFK